MADDTLTTLTADIVTAMVANNDVSADELPELITSVHTALASLGVEPVVELEAAKPTGAVTARKSLSDPEWIISMIDGRRYKTLKRHLSGHGYTPASYREAFGLKADYPMSAPAYTERRKEIAQAIGLGRKAGKAIAGKAGSTKRPKRKTGMEALVEARGETASGA